MSKAQEKQTPLAVLTYKLKLLGLADEQAAKNVLDYLKPKHIPGGLVESINHLITRAMEKQKAEHKAAMQAVIDKL